MEIETARLLLRGFRADDLDEWHRKVFSDADVMRYLPSGAPVPKERVEPFLMSVMDHWKSRGYGVWAVTDRDGGDLFGHCGLRYLHEIGQVELLYALARSAWGKGLATEAAEASVRFGFEQADLARLVALAVPANMASRRVMEKVGMRHERNISLFGLRCAQYAMSREGWQPPTNDYRIVTR